MNPRNFLQTKINDTGYEDASSEKSKTSTMLFSLF